MERSNRHDSRASMLELLSNAEIDINNTKFSVEYSPPTLQNMLLAYKDTDGAIGPAENAIVRQLFRDR